MSTISVLGTCHHDCPDSCGWIATATDGVVVSVKGNPDHPYSQGELCPKVNRIVHRINSDERILTPLIRTGTKGDSEFREASWDEALSLVVEQVNRVSDEHGGQAILHWNSAGTQGAIQQSSIDRPLFARLGASVQIGNVCGQAAGAGMAMTYGHSHGADPLNVEHAKLVVLWATNTRLTNRHLWPWVQKARERGAKVIAIDPIRTITTDAVDQHIQPLPGTDIALMLGMMRVLIEEDLLDHEYLHDHAEGFDELAESVRHCTPEWTGAICGLDPDVVVELARAYGHADPAFIRTLIGPEHHQQGAMFYRTLACLPVLTGSWRKLGGGVARSCGSWQEINDVSLGVFDGLVEVGDRRELPQPQLGRTLTELHDPPIHALFVTNGNPVVSMPNAAAIRKGLRRPDLFTVVSEQFMTDTAAFADVIFPAATQVENLDVVPSWGHLWLGWNEPVTKPRGQAVSNTELWRRLAASFGFDDPVFSASDLELVDLVLGEHVDMEALRRDGFVRIRGTENLMPYAEGNFGSPSRKALLLNPDLEMLYQPTVPRYIASVEGPHGELADYPLVLMTPKKQLRFLNTSYSGLDGHRDREAGPFLELDPFDAEARGLGDGDGAAVWNDRGRLELTVRVSDRLRPGVASVPWGWWAQNYGDTGAVVNDLTNDGDTDWGGGAAYGDTRVEVKAV